MENLSINQIVHEAPAARPRRDAEENGLIDTSRFLRFAKTEFDLVPVAAIQGSSHRDASRSAKPENGRHLVIAAGRSGLALVLLNSHNKDRRAHVGVGLYRDGVVMIGPSKPIQRWKGFEAPVRELMDSGRTPTRLGIVANILSRMENRSERMPFARYMSAHAYLPTVDARPSAKSLVEGYDGAQYLKLGFHVLKRMQEGNLEPREEGGRRIKRVQRPDGLFHAGMVCLYRLMGMARAAAHLPTDIDFGGLTADRVVRP